MPVAISKPGRLTLAKRRFACRTVTPPHEGTPPEGGTPPNGAALGEDKPWEGEERTKGLSKARKKKKSKRCATHPAERHFFIDNPCRETLLD